MGKGGVCGFEEPDELVLAYATPIYNSQGSEYPAVVILLTTQHYAMLARKLLYTGVTRCKRLVVPVGQSRALATAVTNQDGRRRWSKLHEWLEVAGPERRWQDEPGRVPAFPGGCSTRCLKPAC